MATCRYGWRPIATGTSGGHSTPTFRTRCGADRFWGLKDIKSMGRCPRKDVRMTEKVRERRPRRSFSPQFKTEVVELVRTSGKSIAAVAREMDLTETAVREWVRQAEVDAGKRVG